MAENVTIARPYAEAVFGLADKANALAAWSKTLAAMAAVAGDPQMRACMGDPKLGPDRLYALFVSLAGKDLGSEQQNFVRVLRANERLALLPEIHRLFEELKNEREGVAEARIESACPLEPAQLAALVERLQARFKRRIEAQVSVDKALIGGARITVGDEVIDGTVRGKLVDMTVALKS